MWLNNFRHVKLKVGVAGQDDARRLARIRTILGRKIDVRLDANEAWSPDEVVGRVAALRPSNPSVIEQPVPHAQVEALATMRPHLGLPVMLDESLCGYPDAESAVRDKTADLLNVRISKCGGIGPSLRIVGLARRHGLGVQLGCHPGETGILSAAGRHIASMLKGIRYLEGSYDRHILADNLIREDITFGYGGRAKPLSGPGLGVTIDEQALERMTVVMKEIRFD
jgi:muconate cycloisomerase